MKRAALCLVLLMICTSIQPVLADIPAPNDHGTLPDGTDGTLSIDGFVTTKFASVGSDVVINAHTRGTDCTPVVTADILQYPQVDAVDLFTSVSSFFPETSYVDTIVLAEVGAHEDDADTTVWEGIYTIPTNIRGGVYGASVTVDDCSRTAIDTPTQLTEVFFGEIEKILQSIDTAWDTANPTAAIQGEFSAVEDVATQNGAGSWSHFVATASEGPGVGGSAQFWDAMIDAGHNQYNMSAGANFLEALMGFLDSNDVDAAMTMLIGLMTYANEFPLPRHMEDFDAVVDYIQEFDPIENFTRFEGTDDFEDAYNALIGSDEYNNLMDALDDLANSTRQFEAVQTILHNLALLAVSGHPQAIFDALEAWAQPLMDMDYAEMTPWQLLIVRFIEMAEELNEETDIQDTDNDDVPDIINWQYEYLLETTEGQAWTANIEADNPWVNLAFDEFNALPENCIGHVFDSFSDPVWENVGNTMNDFGDWMQNATLDVNKNVEWPSEDDDDEDDDEGGDEEEPSGPTTIIFEDLSNIQTSKYDKNYLDLFVKLQFWGPDYFDDEKYPPSFTMTAENNHGDSQTISLQQHENNREYYTGQFTVEDIQDAIWSFSQPMEDYAHADEVEHAVLHMESLLPSMLESMATEGIDEMFAVSALGVIVDQDETSLVSSSYDVNAVTYDSQGVVENAHVDVAIIRVSPQTAEEAFDSLSAEGDIDMTISEGDGVNTADELRGQYTGSDLDGDVSATLSPFENDDDGRDHPQAAEFDEISIPGAGIYWDASNDLPATSGLAEISTSGITENGLEFTFTEEIALPGTTGCARSEVNPSGENRVDVMWGYDHFRNDRRTFDRPDFYEISIDWGDGDSYQHTNDDMDDYRETDWESHQYMAPGTYNIDMSYVDENNVEVTHSFTFKSDEGMYQDHEDEYRWEQARMGWCDLEMDESFMPSAEIIDAFITDGPLEVNTEVIMVSDSDGEVELTVDPTLPGVYITVVQSEIVRFGEKFTGIGLNIVAVTEATVDFSGDSVVEETTFAGLPVYSIETDAEHSATVTVTSNGLDFSNVDSYTGALVILPVDMSVPFPDVDEDAWSVTGECESVQAGEEAPEDGWYTADGDEESTWVEQGDVAPTDGIFCADGWDDGSFEFEFEEGMTSHDLDIVLHAPLSLVLIVVMEDEDSIWPEAVHIGLLLNDPVDLDITGDLGPGQTANVAIADEDDTTRILAVATPKLGFDPASIDFSAFTEVIYEHGVREEIGWIASERKRDQHCETVTGYHEDYDDGNGNTRLDIYPYRDHFGSVIDEYPDYNPTIYVIDNENGTLMNPIQDWTFPEGESSYNALYHLDMDREYRIESDSEWELETNFWYEWDDEGWAYLEFEEQDACPETGPETEEEVFELFDEVFSNLDSIAWGQGSSADLRLPILSSPQDEYTVIAVAQIGEGDSASVVAAIGGEMATPNPEEQSMQNLSLSFSPDSPKPMDAIVVTIVDEDGQPVDDLSVTLEKDNVTIYGFLTDADGQVAIPGLPEGTIYVRAGGGGLYHPSELVITISDDEFIVDDPDGPQPGDDSDGDGWTDLIEIDCGTDPLDGTDVPVDSDGDGFCDAPDDPEDVMGCTNSTATNYNASATMDDGSCVFADDDDDNPDADGDGIPDDLDDCEDTDADVEVDEDGCPIDDDDDDSDTSGDEEEDDGSSSTSDTESGVSPMIVASGVGLAVVGAGALVFLFLRRGKDDEWASDSGEIYTNEDRLFNAPNTPAPGMRGEMMDGYECIEHPAGSGAWWYRDPATGKWAEWK